VLVTVDSATRQSEHDGPTELLVVDMRVGAKLSSDVILSVSSNKGRLTRTWACSSFGLELAHGSIDQMLLCA
jgi:hypothetical protein